MAAVTLLTSAVSTLNADRTAIATPSVGDLIVLVVFSTANAASYTPSDNRGGSYSLVIEAEKNSGADGLQIYVAGAAIASALSTTFTYSTAPDANTGGGMLVFAVSGLSKAGSAAIRQSAGQANVASGTPSPSFPAAALTTNPLIGIVMNGANAATLTPRTGWTELYDSGFATPTTGVEAMAINSGETATGIVWGSSSATEFASLAVEFDASSLAITGTLTATLGDVTLSSDGSISINGSLSSTLDALTLNATGSVSINGTASITLGALTLSADGQQGSIHGGDLSSTFGDLTLTATGSLSLNADLSVTLDELTATITGDLGLAPGEWVPIVGPLSSWANDASSITTWTLTTPPLPSWH